MVFQLCPDSTSGDDLDKYSRTTAKMLSKTADQLKNPKNKEMKEQLQKCYLREVRYLILDNLCWKEDNVMENFYLFFVDGTECATGASSKPCRILDMIYRVVNLARNICRKKKTRPLKPRRKRQFSEYDILHSLETATCDTNDEEYVNMVEAYIIVSEENKPYNTSENNLAIRPLMCCTLKAALEF